MAQEKSSLQTVVVQEALLSDPDFLRSLTEHALQRIIDQQFDEQIGAKPYERAEERKGWRNGSRSRSIRTRVGTIELMVPRDREGRFQPSLFERYNRSEKTLVQVMQEMVIKGVSTRKVTEVVETLCGTEVSASLVSDLSAQLDDELDAWRNRQLETNYPIIILDATYQKVRHAGHVVSQAVVVVTGVNGKGRRSVLSLDVFHNENETEYGELFERLKEHNLKGVRLIVSDDHSGLQKALQRHFCGVLWQRCQVHYTKNLLDKLRKRDKKAIKQLLRDAFEAPDREKAEERFAELAGHLRELGYADAADWLEDTFPDTLSVYAFPREFNKRIRSTNSIERLNEELRRRVRVLRIFPNRASCLRMNTALCQDMDERWDTGKRYLDMALLREQDLETIKLEINDGKIMARASC